VLVTKETGESVVAEIMVGCAGAELIMELGLAELILCSSALDCSPQTVRRVFNRPLAITST
jgi:hypothetical protein